MVVVAIVKTCLKHKGCSVCRHLSNVELSLLYIKDYLRLIIRFEATRKVGIAQKSLRFNKVLGTQQTISWFSTRTPERNFRWGGGHV